MAVALREQRIRRNSEFLFADDVLHQPQRWEIAQRQAQLRDEEHETEERQEEPPADAAAGVNPGHSLM